MIGPKHLIVVVGPTASGKTKLAIDIATYFKTEIISCDSRQFYKETNIGTAKPTSEELATVKHHFVNNLSIQDTYDVCMYEQEVLALLNRKFSNHDILVAVGGSGLFVNAICEGFDEMPVIPSGIREYFINKLNEEGLESLTQELLIKDPVYHAQVDLKNPQRIIRALEVIEASGMPFSSFRKKKKSPRDFKCIKIGLDTERETLYERIDKRMDQMIADGLFEEARSLYPFRSLNPLKTVGYSEIFDFFDGHYDKTEAIRLLKRNSRRYAKRQLTWFAKDKDIFWFKAHQLHQILDFLAMKTTEK